MMNVATFYRGRITFKELFYELEFRVVSVLRKDMFNQLKTEEGRQAKAGEQIEDEIIDHT